MSSNAAQPGSVSVALCTWNGKSHLQAQLDSIASQTRLPAELVVCDDNSPDSIDSISPDSIDSISLDSIDGTSPDSISDNTATNSTIGILESFARTAPFPVRIYRNASNLGGTANFEQAISLCRGEFIALCDQDDIWYPEKLATLSSILLHQSQCGGVFSDGDLLETDGAVSTRTLWQSIRFDQKDQQLLRNGRFADVLLRRNVITGMTLMLRSSIRDRLLPIPGSWVHDAWLGWTIALNSELIACPERLVAYRVHPSQQLGVPMSRSEKLAWVARKGLGSYFERARTTSISSNHQLAQQYRDLCMYVEANRRPGWERLLTRLRQKAALAESSAATALLARPLRLGHLARNASNYFRYTQLPVRSIFRDLVL